MEKRYEMSDRKGWGLNEWEKSSAVDEWIGFWRTAWSWRRVVEEGNWGMTVTNGLMLTE